MKRYEGERIEVTYDTVRCLHAGECVPAFICAALSLATSWLSGRAV